MHNGNSDNRIQLIHAIGKPILIGLAAISLSGCYGGARVTDSAPAWRPTVVQPAQRLAVLPFVNKTDNQDIAGLIRRAFYCHLSIRPYQDIELHVVDEKLRQLGFADAAALSKVSIKKLGEALGCEALVTGEVSEFKRLFLGVYSQLSLGASITVWDTRSGTIIWSDHYVARKHEGGVPLSLFELPLISIRSGWNLRESQKVSVADELTRQLAQRMPTVLSRPSAVSVSDPLPAARVSGLYPVEPPDIKRILGGSDFIRQP